MDLPEYLDKIYRLSYITRYSNQVRIKDEDVAQHSFFVAAIVIWLWEKYDFNLEHGLLCAITHDMIEAGIGDVTNDIKVKYPALRKAITEAENVEIEEFIDTVKTGFSYFERGNGPAAVAAQLADAIQVRQYCRNEISMGNKQFSKIHDEVEGRICKLSEVMKQYERKKDTTK